MKTLLNEGGTTGWVGTDDALVETTVELKDELTRPEVVVDKTEEETF